MLQQINTENFQQMLSQFSTGELESMIEKFPYFQQAHLLLAKKYQQENSPKFDQQLQLAALYIQDRELLYNLFNDRNIVEPVVEPVKIAEPQQEQKEIVTQPQNIEPVVIAEPLIQQKEAEEQTPITAKTETIETAPVSDQDAITLALEEIKKTMGAIQQISEDAKAEEVTEPEQTLSPDRQEIQETSSVTDTPVEEVPVETEIEVVETILAAPVVEEFTEPIIEESEEESIEQPQPEAFSRIAPHTFDEWLQAFNNKTVSKSPEKQVEPISKVEDEELTQLYAANVTSDYLHGIVKEETNYAKGLERFIDEQIQKHKQPEKKRKEPKIVTDNELVTETMAKVYEMQKKYNLAIKAYEALTLKFPEKSSLFAARIDLLKNIH